MLRRLNWFGYLGIVAAVVTILSWVMLALTEPFGHDEAKWIGFLIITLMIGLSLLAAWSSFKQKVSWLYVTFFISFFPVGLYLLFTPGMGKWIGIGNLMYLVNAIGIYVQTRKKRSDASQQVKAIND